MVDYKLTIQYYYWIIDHLIFEVFDIKSIVLLLKTHTNNCSRRKDYFKIMIIVFEKYILIV